MLLDTDLKIILWNDQNNYVRLSSMIKIAAKSFDVLSINLKLEIFHIIILVI